jgi:hypothetical protein
MANANTTNLGALNQRVSVLGQLGTVRGVERDGFILVQLDGEDRVDAWHPSQVEAA